MATGNTVWIGGLPNKVDDETFRAIVEQYGSPTSTKVFTNKWYGFADFATSEEANEAVAILDGAEFQGRILQVKIKIGGKGSAPAPVSGWKGSFQAWTQDRAAPRYASPYESSSKGAGKGSSITVAVGKGDTGMKGDSGNKGFSGGGGQFSGSLCHSQDGLLVGRNDFYSKGEPSSNLHVKGLPPDADELTLYKLFAPLGTVLSTFVKQNPIGPLGFVTYSTDAEAQLAIEIMNGQMTTAGTTLGVSVQWRKDNKFADKGQWGT